MFNYWSPLNTSYHQFYGQTPIFFFPYPYKEPGNQNQGKIFNNDEQKIYNSSEKDINKPNEEIVAEKQKKTTQAKPIKPTTSQKLLEGKKKKIRKDEEYKQRRQKVDRNAPSSAIKLFFKYITFQRLLFKNYFNRIKEKYSLKASSEEFFQEIDNKFNFKSKYFSPFDLLKYCQKRNQFGLVMAILLNYFFNVECHLKLSHKFNCNKKLFRIHIKAGRKLVKKLKALHDS